VLLHVRYEVFVALTMKVTVFLDVIPYNQTEIY